MNHAPLATPTSPADPRGDTSGAGDEYFRWDLLVSRVLHPAQVGIIEALLWIEVPAAPSDVVQMFEGRPYSVSHLGYHSNALIEFGVLELAYTEPVRGTLKHYYALTPEFRCR
jgi:hypothetical protein